MRLVRPMKDVMQVHKEKCDGSGLMVNINKKQEIIPNRSYSMIHALEENFAIMIYSCTHDTKMWNGCVRKKHTVMLILGKEMIAM